MAFNITSVIRIAGLPRAGRPMCECSNVGIDHEAASSAFIPFGHESDVGPLLPARNEGGGTCRRAGTPSREPVVVVSHPPTAHF